MLGLGLHIKKNINKGSIIPILDEFPNAAVAYSLRELSTDWKGQPVVRLRRNVDNAEADFTMNEITDGTLTTWTGASNGLVIIWYDQSGNNVNALQNTSIKQPLLYSGLNGIQRLNERPAIKFDGIDDTLYTTSFPRTNAGTFIIARRFLSGGICWGVRTTSSNNRQFSEATNGLTAVNANSSVIYIGVAVTPNAFSDTLLFLFADGISDVKSMANGIDFAVDSAITNDWFIDVMRVGDTFQFGAKSDTGGSERGYGNVLCSEFVYYTDSLFSDRNKLSNKFLTYFNI